MTEWYYSKEGVQVGPVGRDELMAKVRSGEVSAADLVWKEGLPAWTASGAISELQDGTVVGGGSVPVTQPVALPPDFAEKAVPSYLWQSIVALVVSVLLCLFMCIPLALPTGVVALVFSTKVEGLSVQGRRLEALSASRTAKVCMIVTASLCALQALGLAGVIVFAISQS